MGILNQRRSLATIFKDSPKEHVKLLEIMLSFDPKNRLSAKGLLENPIFDKIRNKKIEKGCPKKIYVPVDSITIDENTDVRQLILETIS